MPAGIAINSTPALFPATTCKTCNRAVYVKDVDKKGNCVFCQGSALDPNREEVAAAPIGQPASEAAPAATTPPATETTPASK